MEGSAAGALELKGVAMFGGKSQVRGVRHPPLLEQTIGQALDWAVERWGDELALISVDQGARWSWRQLAGKADDLAAGLLAIGLEPGDRVGVWAPNCAEWTLTQFAAARAGLILVTINPAYRRSELAYTLNKVGVKALIAAERYKSSDYVGMIEGLAPEVASSAPGALACAALPALKALIAIGAESRPGWLRFEQIADGAGEAGRARVAAIARRLKPRDAINIQFTSGTTGSPKGATLSHRNIVNNGYFVGRAMGLKADDRLCIPVPLYHCFGMVMGNLACLAHGAAMVYPSPTFDAAAALASVEAEACTGLFGVPTMFIAMLGAP
ncbi:MAG: AMP-binding protein, partial [Caulobacteraceae bacterium]